MATVIRKCSPVIDKADKVICGSSEALMLPHYGTSGVFIANSMMHTILF